MPRKKLVDIGIITIREDEFEAVLQRFPDKIDTASYRRRYRIRRLQLNSNQTYTIAIVRCVEQGNSEAQAAARDLLEDLNPSWLFVVGIAGGVPANEFTLGDVIVSTRITDFSVEAVLKDHSREYALAGGPLHPNASKLAADIRAMVLDGELDGWNSNTAITMAPPPVVIADELFYGDEDWRRDVREKITRHFQAQIARLPLVTAGPIASSDRLIKEAEILQIWLKMSRQIQAVEMESAGVYRAVYGRNVPFLAIRGISDVVGYKRHPDWTAYACHTAAAFLLAFLRTGVILPRTPKPKRGSSKEQSPFPKTSIRDSGSGAIFALFYDKAGDIIKPDSLFGHIDLLHRLSTRLDENKHVLLTGYGGTGKTAIAATLADQRLAEGKGPIVCVQARRGTADALFEKIAILFNEKEKLDRVEGDAQIQCMRAMLTEHGVKMLVLDDIRNEGIVVPMRQVARELPMLLTSRHVIENVDAGENVTDLAPDDALELLIHHARNEEIDEASYRADPEARQLCQEVGYHALGIVIAGRWLAQHKRKPGALLARIAQRRLTPATIEMPASFVVEGRETVKMVLDESSNALQPATQRMVKVFGSLFEPHVTTKLLAICAGFDDRLATEDALDELVLWNLASRTDDYYTMHDMMHTYAETVQFGNAEPDRRPMVAAVQRYLKDYSQDFDTLELDQPNILRAAEEASDEERTSIIRTLTLDGYFNARGHTLYFLALLDQVLTYLRARKKEETLKPDQLEMLHYLLGKRGDAYFDRGDYDKALETFKESLKLATRVNRIVILSGVIGRTLSFRGAHDEARKYFEQGYKLATEAKDDFLLSFVLEQEAWAAGHNEDHDTARQIAAKQVAINEQLLETNRDSQQERALLEALIWSLVNLGTAEIRVAAQPPGVTDTAVAQGQKQSALANFQRAEQIAVSMNHTLLHITALFALAEGFHFLDEREKAFDLLQKVQELYRRRGITRGENLVITFMQKHGYLTTSHGETDKRG